MPASPGSPVPRIRSSAHGEPTVTIETTTGLAVFGRTTTRADGDFAVGGAGRGLDARRSAVVDLPWSWLQQVHGAEVVVVDGPGSPAAGAPADALVTAAPGVVLAVQTADCAPLLLWSDEGVIGAVHAGWHGLLAGVVEAAADAMRALGATSIEGDLGPCIHAECYEFGEADLDRVAGRLGDEVRGVTAAGTPALDLVAGVGAAARQAGIDLWPSTVDLGEQCTACNEGRWFSHRARTEPERMATVIWREGGAGA